MMKHIKPATPGLVVRDHAQLSRVIPAEGAEVVWDGTWARRERAGDIEVFDPVADEKKAPQELKRAESKAKLKSKSEAPRPRKSETNEVK
ncbi:DUF2635 domain-containing protein [Sulfitobacter sp. 1A15106]|uniref:DUF2635 domain-containing protein n=1 Tax=Sulfitobacter sp. 1A15106 TaxID=3368590 RepID=UPI0037467814